jgi:SAM-dependent methyltransferase
MGALKYSVEEFFELFVKELDNSPSLHSYYKFHKKDKSYTFRKAYFIQRLQYIADHVKQGAKIFDCGCGYATTAIFLTLNGFEVYGSTLEFYYDEIGKRLEYWKQFGDLDSLVINYENLFDDKTPHNTYDTIIAQDTLHHLEPFNEAIVILSDLLKKSGQLIAIEENGSNIVQNLKLYKQRGNKRIITFYDEKLKRDILIGNENIRSINKWKKEFAPAGLTIDNNSLAYVRVFPPQFFGDKKIEEVIKKEQNLKAKNALMRKYFFFGINFVANKS